MDVVLHWSVRIPFPCFCGMSCVFWFFFSSLLNRKIEGKRSARRTRTVFTVYTALGACGKQPSPPRMEKVSLDGAEGMQRVNWDMVGGFCHKPVPGNWCLECSSSPTKCAKESRAEHFCSPFSDC